MQMIAALMNQKSLVKAILPFIITLFCLGDLTSQEGFQGYYRFPTIHNETIVFTAEGDLWKVSASGGLAQRLTTHHSEEIHPRLSPDGKTIAFSASYEGPVELYTMPLAGGLPQRWTYEQEGSYASGWTPAGELLYATRQYATLPDYQTVSVNLISKTKTVLPLSQATETCYSSDGSTVYFVRPSFHNNVTKRYTGGTARNIWRFAAGDQEAVNLTADYNGESHHPQWWNGRIYFITDRDGTMNIWSMLNDGSDLLQHTYHKDFDVRSISLSGGRIVYQRGADIWLYDISQKTSAVVQVTLTSDMDQLREKWETNPMEYLTSAHIDSTGDKVVLTARGRIFVAPVKNGRLVQLSRKSGVRYRDAVFSAAGNEVITLSDESGEFELVKMSADGIGAQTSLTSDGTTLRFDPIPSPDGRWIAFRDLDQHLWIYDVKSKQSKKVSKRNNDIGSYSWSPDSRWLSYTQDAANIMTQIFLYEVSSGTTTALTTDRANSYSPAWSADGKWIYFLSDRNFESLVGGPWGPRQPEPYFDNKFKIYHVALQKGLRSPFRPKDELYSVGDEEANNEINVTINTDGIQRRIQEVPVPAGNYYSLSMNDKALYFMSRETGLRAGSHLHLLKLDNEKPEPVVMAKDVSNYELSADGKKMLIRKNNNLYVVNAGTSEAKLDDAKIDLKNWSFSIDVHEDWRQIFTDAWRMERDYFYDPNMHGVDWDAMYEKYLPLVDRVTTRPELSDLIGRFVGELSALHTSVRGGDIRQGKEDIDVASLGAKFQKDKEQGGFKIEYIYRADPDYPDERSPLDHPELSIAEGDVITHINGVSVKDALDIGELLRNQAGQQVRISYKSSVTGLSHEAIVVPLSSDYDLRYRDWEYSRRLITEEKSKDEIGYVHLRAMGPDDLSQWYREFYPVFNRKGLIIDVRHNRGGNIESIILEKLLRKAWMYWQVREQDPYWNMQYAFRGHMVVLCDENTASDGEAFADGFRRLGMGKVIGKRTWGGEIWLSSANRLTDEGLARAPMMGVYGPEGEWLIEQIGVIPDIEVDNLPHETFMGKDAQLDAAIRHLLDEIEKDPRDVPKAPPFPDKSFKG